MNMRRVAGLGLTVLCAVQALAWTASAHERGAEAAAKSAHAFVTPRPAAGVRPRLYARHLATIPQVPRWSAPIGRGPEVRLASPPIHCPPVPPRRACPSGASSADPFVDALIDSPNARTIPILTRLGIPVIRDVPPIVIINPD
jgi:hypothetical protein